MRADIYSGWITAFVDGVWRRVHIAPGFATIADWTLPNEHLGVFALADIEGARDGVALTKLEHSPYALVGPEITDKDTLERVAYVRFGRIARTTNWGPNSIVDNETMLHLSDLDDLTPLDPFGPRVAPPYRHARWTRTPRSMIVS